jgi:NADH dehydrogenase FAD-containing subunit
MLKRYGVEVRTGAKAERMTPEGVVVSQNEKNELLRCRSVVLACGTQSVRPEDAGDGWAGEVRVIGDAKSPRKAYEAIREGFDTGRNL